MNWSKKILRAVQHHRRICDELYSPPDHAPVLVICTLPADEYGSYLTEIDSIQFDPHKHESEDEILDTLLHEHAHAMMTPKGGHGPQFRALHQQLVGMLAGAPDE